MLPTVTFPKLRLAGLTLSCGVGAATPVPLIVTNVGLLPALLTKETCPEAAPVAVGANCVVYVELCPGFNVSGTLTPLKVNPVPDGVICEIVTLTFPVLLTPTDWEPLLPTVTFPKATEEGSAVSCATGTAVPVPLNTKLVGESDALLTNETLPLADPVVDGAKFSE